MRELLIKKHSHAVVVGEVGGLGVVISCDGWGGPLCWNKHVCGKASNRLRCLGSSCLTCFWSQWRGMRLIATKKA